MPLVQKHVNKLEIVTLWLHVGNHHASMINAFDIACFFEWHVMVSIDNGDGGDRRHSVCIAKKKECKHYHGAEWCRKNNNNKQEKSLTLCSKKCTLLQKNAILTQQKQHYVNSKKGVTVIVCFYGR